MGLTDRIYRVDSDDVGWSRSYVDASHRWTLPGLRCPGCLQTVIGAPLAYPSISTPKLGRTATRKGCWPVFIEQFEPLVRHVRSVTKRRILIKQGVEFGPYEGKAVGPVTDFMWGHSWYLLARKGVIQRLEDEGVKLPLAVEPVLKYPRNQPTDLLEFEIEPKVSWDLSKLPCFDESKTGRPILDPSTGMPKQPDAFQCKTCGYFKSGLPEGEYPPLLVSSFPRNIDLVRVKQASGMIVANERFVKAVQKLGLKNITFKPMKVSQA